ncbi:hypothetical protein [Paenibacillus odorifer]|uniref:hypothetical protein n=1 Tax=Paenibacillus odorifer TaxID=189426 RepID=UPI00096C637A|nr:hypothetical protein [Paenibacillus odorifer]OMD78244.1 hypothetical protein BSK50_10880 [Paenibacillus odorifer]
MRRIGTLNLLEEYGIVAGELSTDGEHLEPYAYIKGLIMDETVAEEEVRAFLDNYYLPDVVEAFIGELYK